MQALKQGDRVFLRQMERLSLDKMVFSNSITTETFQRVVVVHADHFRVTVEIEGKDEMRVCRPEELVSIGPC